MRTRILELVAVTAASLLACSTQGSDLIERADDAGPGGGAGAGGNANGGAADAGGNANGGAADAGGNTNGGAAGSCESYGHDGLCKPFCAVGMAGAVNMQPEPPPEDEPCPVVGAELCNKGLHPSFHVCTDNGWQTVENVSDCVEPQEFQCNSFYGSVDGTCCPVEVYCPFYGYCDGTRWYRRPACLEEGKLGETCSLPDGGAPCSGTTTLGGCWYTWKARLACVDDVWSAPAIARCEKWSTPPMCDPTGVWDLAYAGLPSEIAGLAAPNGASYEVGVYSAVVVWFGATNAASVSDDGCHLTMQSIRHYPASNGGAAIDETISVDLTISGQSAAGTVQVLRTGAEPASGSASATRHQP